MAKRENPYVGFDGAQVVQEFENLCAKLGEQRDQYTNGADYAADRRVTMDSVAAVHDFLYSAVPGAIGIRQVFLDLLGHLLTVCDGDTSPLFTPPEDRGRRGKKRLRTQAYRWAAAAAWVTQVCTLNKERSLSEACRIAEQAFILAGVPLPRPRDPEGKKILNYRHDLMKPANRDTEEGRIYYKFLANAKAQSDPGHIIAKRMRGALLRLLRNN